MDQLLPGGERPEARPHICEMTEGKTVSGSYWLEVDALPPGWRGMGLEFSTSETLLIMAAPPWDRCRLVFRWLPKQAQWTRSMARIYGLGLDRATPDDFIKAQLQGQTVRYVHPAKAQRHDGGEEMRIEFRSGDEVYVVALPGDGPFCADLDVQVVRKGKAILGPR